MRVRLCTQVTTDKDFVPEYASTCSADALSSSLWMAALAAVGNPAAFADALKALQFGPIVGHYVQHAEIQGGANQYFYALCGCRWAVCGQKATAGLPEPVVAFTQGLCRRHFTTPLNARQYYYHAPALHPQFDERDFNASEENAALFPHMQPPPLPAPAPCCESDRLARIAPPGCEPASVVRHHASAAGEGGTNQTVWGSDAPSSYQESAHLPNVFRYRPNLPNLDFSQITQNPNPVHLIVAELKALAHPRAA